MDVVLAEDEVAEGPKRPRRRMACVESRTTAQLMVNEPSRLSIAFSPVEPSW
jgi:hypothetical protein